jgi:hypothetical protein
MPDEISRTVTFSNNQITMPTNTDADRYVQVKIDYSLGSNSKEIIYYSNNVHNLISQSTNALLDVNIHEDVEAEVRMTDNTYTDFTGSHGITKIVTSGDVYIDNLDFRNSTGFGATLFDFENCQMIEINNMVITNVTTDETLTGAFFHSYSSSDMDITVDNLTVSTIVLNQYVIANFEGKLDKVIFTNSNLEGLSYGSDNTLIYVHNVNTVYVDSITFSDISGNNNVYSNSYLIRINTLNVNSTEDTLVQNVNIQNSVISFIELDQLAGSTSEPRQFVMENIVLSETVFYHSFNLIYSSKILTSEDFVISLKNITFEDLSFVMGGNLIYLSSQLLNGFIVTDLYISNVKGAGIYIEAHDKQSPIKAKMTLNNITTNHVNLEYRSLITLEEGSEIDIHDSLIHDITSYETGAVIYAKGPSAVATIYDCTFENNTAYEGALFWIESSSVVKLYNGQIQNNFAVQASISLAKSEGHFEFYNTSVFGNYAMSNPVALIIDSSSTSLLND